MSEECCQTEVKDFLNLFIVEDKDLERRPLDRVVPQVISEQFQTNFRLELLLEHPCEDVVEDCEHG